MRRPVDLPNARRPRGFDPLLVRGWARALLRGKRLPPGRMSPPLDAIERADRNALIERARELGPVFKGTAWGGALWIYVFGLDRGRSLLAHHADDLRPVTIDLQSLFPIGFMRQMEDAEHRNYRAALIRAIRTTDFAEASGGLRAIVARHLAAYVKSDGRTARAPEAYRSALTGIATDVLLRLMFGTEPGDTLHAELLDGYRMLGSSAMVWNIRPRQAEAFGRLAASLREELVRLDAGTPRRPCVLSRLLQDGPVDSTMLGNLIYMVEMGRHDVAGLLRWLSFFAAHHGKWLDRIADEGALPDIAEAFVRETLRLEQSERLVRTVKRDFVFEDFFYPRGAMVRVCVWEAHKSAEAFDDPFAFDPQRFMLAPPGHDRYAPFGIDRHQCPFAGFSVSLGVIFVQALADHYRVDIAGDAKPVRGQYHWEPAESFAPALSPRLRVASAADA